MSKGTSNKGTSGKGISSETALAKPGKSRLDMLIVKEGLAESRSKAQALVMAGDVLVDGQTVSKPGTLVNDDAEISIRAAPPYVSRGGVKLERALDAFGVSVAGLVVLDVGASTGGFTDVLLKRGAARVYAIDVGYGQFDWRLRNDPRVVLLERTNIRHLAELPELADAAAIDVSFISLTQVLPAVLRLITPAGWIIPLVKPQFEAGREQVGKGGVVRDKAVHRQVLRKMVEWAHAHDLKVLGIAPSPLRGPAGNREFLLHLRREGAEPDLDAAIAAAVRED